jgi:predicted adenine nucleotide alpha hydrolase (AANH) superfamily ATPase/nicotinic acid mononucleotide adenylyltransferase
MLYIFGAAFDPPHVAHSAIIRALLHFKNPTLIVVVPSWIRNDKTYTIDNQHRLELCNIFLQEINDPRVILDTEFFSWTSEMTTKDVDIFAREKYEEDIIHVFGTDTALSMPYWDNEWYAARHIQKLFVPRWDVLPQFEHIENYELFTDSHIPDVSSTVIRETIPEYTWLKAYFEEHPNFIIPGLSKRISRYILDNKLYRPKLLDKPTILVHICCGPDATMPIFELREEYNVVCFWYDPNIQPKKEHDKRYEAFVKVCTIEGVPHIKGAYDVKNFFSRIKGLEHTPEKWEKCTNCYDMRMYVAAKLAHRLGIKYYTSSLNTSPKKDLEKLFQIWHKYAKKYGIEFLDIPFRKRGGFEKSVEYTREHDIFRQNYCGCIYSINEWWKQG